MPEVGLQLLDCYARHDQAPLLDAARYICRWRDSQSHQELLRARIEVAAHLEHRAVNRSRIPVPLRIEHDAVALAEVDQWTTPSLNSPLSSASPAHRSHISVPE